MVGVADAGGVTFRTAVLVVVTARAEGFGAEGEGGFGAEGEGGFGAEGGGM